ncbi:diguanylate cyclase [Candidatus Marinimicrobia bacterium MT.SAG.4]|nr:diguanylate cyclase [Candidatus Marinimicrobia bacterium MT.SAG.4]
MLIPEHKSSDSKRERISTIGVGLLFFTSLILLYFMPSSSDSIYLSLFRIMAALTLFGCGMLLLVRSNRSKLNREVSLKELTRKFSSSSMSREEIDLTKIPDYTAEQEYSSYLKLFLESLSDTFVARSAAFYMGGSTMSIQAAVPDEEFDDFHKEIAMGEGILGKILQTGKTILVKSFNEIDEVPDYLSDSAPVKSLLGTPVYYSQKPFGVLFVDSSAEDSFGDSDKKLMERFALLLEKTISQLEYIFNFHGRLHLISELHTSLLSIQRAKRIEDVINYASVACRSLIESDVITISLIKDSQKDTLKIYSTEGTKDNYVDGVEYPVEGGLHGYVFSKNSSVLIPESEEDGYFKPRFLSDEKISGEYHSYLGVPISIGDEIYGVIGLDSVSPAKYSDRDKAVLTSIGTMTGQAISRLKLLIEKRSQNLYDKTTGLPNIKHFKESIEKEIIRAKRYEEKFSIFIIDIDNFGKINKKYSQLAGDLVLKTVGQQAKQLIRESDTVTRYGGDEFSLVILGVSKELAIEIAERVRKDLEKSVLEYKEDYITFEIAIGVSTYPDDGETPDALIAKADKALIGHTQSKGGKMEKKFIIGSDKKV